MTKTKGLFLGARFNGQKSHGFLTLEGGVLNTNWNGDIHTSTYTLGADIGFMFKFRPLLEALIRPPLFQSSLS